MSCLPTYKGVRYNSLDEIRELLKSQQTKVESSEDIEEFGNKELEVQAKSTEVNLNSTLGLNIVYKQELEQEREAQAKIARENPELDLENFDSIFPQYASFTQAEKRIVMKLAQEGRIEIKCNL